MSIRRDGYRKKPGYEKMWKTFVIAMVTVFAIGIIIGICMAVKYVKTNKQESSFVLVEQNISQDLKIYYHKDTKVMYVKTCGFSPCITVMVDADGKPLLYDGDDEGD